MARLSSTFSALAAPTRRAILARLALGETSVNEIAMALDLSLSAVCKLLMGLVGAALISRGRDAQWRPGKLEAAPLQDAANWIEYYRKFWEASFDRLDAYLQRQQSNNDDDDGSKPKKPKTKGKSNGRK